MLTERPYWPYPRILAHRGGGLLAPENTLAALRYARNLGFEGVEFDVKLTADDVPVLLHDDTLDRTTDGSGAMADMLFDLVTQLDAGSWFVQNQNRRAMHHRFADQKPSPHAARKSPRVAIGLCGKPNHF